MRVSEMMLFNSIGNRLNRQTNSLLKTQEQVSSGKRIAQPSDDPIGHAQVIAYEKSLAESEQYLRNIGQANDAFSITETVLQSVEDQLLRARELSVQMANGIYNATDRADSALEVQQVYDQLIALANTKQGEEYIFAGDEIRTIPFQTDGTYQGDSGESKIPIGVGATVIKNIPGDRLFKGVGGGIDLFKTVKDLQTALEGNDVSGVQTALSTFTTAQDQVLGERALVGARFNRAETSANVLEDFKLTVSELKSDLEDVDITRAISELVLKQNILETTRATAARLMQRTLLDFLR